MDVEILTLCVGDSGCVDVLQRIERCSGVVDGCAGLSLGAGQHVFNAGELQHALTGLTDDEPLALCSGHEGDTGRSSTTVDLERDGVTGSGGRFPRTVASLHGDEVQLGSGDGLSDGYEIDTSSTDTLFFDPDGDADCF